MLVYIHQTPKSGKWRGSRNISLVKVRRFSPERPSTGPSLAFSWLCLFQSFGLQVRKGAFICRCRQEESLGLRWLWQIVLESEDEQMAANATSLAWPIGSLFSVLSGADPGEQWLRNNSESHFSEILPALTMRQRADAEIVLQTWVHMRHQLCGSSWSSAWSVLRHRRGIIAYQRRPSVWSANSLLLNAQRYLENRVKAKDYVSGCQYTHSWSFPSHKPLIKAKAWKRSCTKVLRCWFCYLFSCRREMIDWAARQFILTAYGLLVFCSWAERQLWACRCAECYRLHLPFLHHSLFAWTF